jgi:hypothetical protein
VTITNLGVGVTNGVFLVPLDFGSVFNGAARWLAMGVRSNGNGGTFTALSPLQLLTPTPYALYATNAGAAGNAVMGSVSAAQLNTPGGAPAPGQVLGYNGSALVWTNPAAGGASGSNGWSLTGNAGTSPVSGDFVGTTDNNPLEFHVNGMRAMRLEPNNNGAPNLIGGAPQNYVSNTVIGATIGGGGAANYPGGGTYSNSIAANFGTVGGGLQNTVNGPAALVGGGEGNNANGLYSTVGGGLLNTASTNYATIGGGFANVASGLAAFVGGGGFDGTLGGGNLAGGIASVVTGGWSNRAFSSYSTVAGGSENAASATYAMVGGGNLNIANGAAAFIGGGAGNTASGYESTVGGGFANNATTYYATIGGGFANTASNSYATVGGGSQNTASNEYTTIAGGDQNIASGAAAFVGGGVLNIASGYDSTVSGGAINTASSYYATIGGGLQNSASLNFAAVGGGENNASGGQGSTVGGGFFNVSSGLAATVGGGSNNTSSGIGATVGGGRTNTSSGDYATVSGGFDNNSTGPGATVGGGGANISSGLQATVGGGNFNIASEPQATVGGGQDNVSSAIAATIPGGFANVATGPYSFAAGQQAQAAHTGAFVWADSQNLPFMSGGTDQFCVRARGGVILDDSTPYIYFGTTTRQMLNLYSSTYGIGVQASDMYFRTDGEFWWYRGGSHNDANGNPGGGLWLMHLFDNGNLAIAGTLTQNSDRNVKGGFQPVDVRVVLEKVAAMPFTRWHYTNDPSTPHLGPMAQDFYAAFGLGEDDKHITTVDEGGVALAAIQGLHQEVKAKDAKIAQLEKELAEVKSTQIRTTADWETRFNALQKAVAGLTRQPENTLTSLSETSSRYK